MSPIQTTWTTHVPLNTQTPGGVSFTAFPRGHSWVGLQGCRCPGGRTYYGWCHHIVQKHLQSRLSVFSLVLRPTMGPRCGLDSAAGEGVMGTCVTCTSHSLKGSNPAQVQVIYAFPTHNPVLLGRPAPVVWGPVTSSSCRC